MVQSPAMRRTLAVLVGLVCLALGAAACRGSSGGGRFEKAGFGITFKIPSGFSVSDKISFSKSVGADSVDQAAVGLDNDNGISVSRYNLTRAITSQNLAEIKGLIDRAVGGIAGKEVSGQRVEHSGLPGYEYTFSLTPPPQGQSHLAVLFDKDVEYEINCQSTPNKRDQVEQGCRTVLDSIKPA